MLRVLSRQSGLYKRSLCSSQLWSSTNSIRLSNTLLKKALHSNGKRVLSTVSSGASAVSRSHTVGLARYGIVGRQSMPMFRNGLQSIRLRSSEPLMQSARTGETAAVGAPTAAVPRAVKLWMTGCTAMVFGIITIGGITRLTESGLSMVDWKLSGSLPPMGQEAWEAEFEKYKQFPEFKRLNPHMTVEQFKSIFFWEYLHRMWGRSIGVAFALPFTYFAATRQLSGPVRNRCLLLLGGIGAQGLVGWWMVKSGLEEPKHVRDQPRVSQYRLATHLGAALLLYSGMLWTSLQFWKPSFGSMASESLRASLTAPPLGRLKVMAAATGALVFTTAISGAFVAGLDAGLVYNQFPWMGDGLKPQESWSKAALENASSTKSWLIENLFENSASVQFNHRCLGVTTASVITALFVYTARFRNALPRSVNKARHSMMGMVALQVALGITTLLTYVPVHVAAAHQTGSVVLLSTALWYLHELRRLPK